MGGVRSERDLEVLCMSRVSQERKHLYREGESITAILKGIVKIAISNYGPGLAERVTTV